MADMHWTRDQQEAFSERRAELAVSAAAGSGKTAVLIERVCRAALGIVRGPDGRDITDPAQRVSLDRLLAVTFTNAAAAEMRERLQRALAKAAEDASGDAGLTAVVREQLAALPRAQISTIHSFCGEVVRRYGHLRGISHGRILDGDEATLLRHDLATRYLDEQLGPEAPQELRALALSWGGADGIGSDDLSRVRYSGGLRQVLLSLLDFRRALPDPDYWFANTCDVPDLDSAHCDPSHPVLAPVHGRFAEWLERVTALDTEARDRIGGEKNDAKVLEILAHRLGVYAHCDMADWDTTGNWLARLKNPNPYQSNWTYLTGYRRDLTKHFPHLSALADELNTPVKETAPEWIELFSEPWAEVARRENMARRMAGTLWELATGFEDHYQAFKRARGIADFDDMQRDALAVLAAVDADGKPARDGDGRLLPSEAALELRRRFEMVLVDEHQDTNELQDALIDLVTRTAPPGGGGRPRFFVGDLKQSIYTFRQAVPDLFSTVRDRLEAAPDDRGRHIRLQENFRSRPLLLDAVNQVFDNLLTRDLGGEEYTENRLEAPASVREWSTGAPPELRDRPAELHLVDGGRGSNDDAGEEDGGADGEQPQRLEAAYGLLAGLLRDMHDRGDVIREKSGVSRPVRWRDMAVLMRSTANRVEALLATFARYGIPVYAAGRSGFYERPEVADALSLLRVIDNPRQDIPLAAVLRGPAVGLSGNELLSVARSLPPETDPAATDLWDRLNHYVAEAADPRPTEHLGGFLARLAEWRDLARLAPVPELLWRVYADTGLPAAAATQPGGEQRLANLHRLHDLARQLAGFERQGLARFLRALELSRRAAGDLGEAPVLTEAQDVVRVLTVHQSKGLEFPVVAVPDLDKDFNFLDLHGDVLWHRTAGIGGRMVDWNTGDATGEYNPAVRHETFAQRAVKQAKDAEIRAEELRIHYVALTRARERLILTGTIDRDSQGALRQPKPAAEARCWLHWIGARLQEGINAAETSDVPVDCGPGGCWRVALHPVPAPPAPAKRAQATEGAGLSPANAALINARLNPDYATPGSRLLHAKLTVTRLSHRETSIEDIDPVTDTAPHEPLNNRISLIQPGFLLHHETHELSPAEYGTAVHLLLAELDLAAEPDPAAISTVLDQLVGSGRLDTAVAGLVDPQRIAGSLAEVRGLFDPGRAKLYPELPAAMLVPGHDGPLLGQLAGAGLTVPGPGTTAATDRVYVQGVIDLLVVDGDTATVIDYKTDRGADAETLAARYRGQLEWYCRMVRALLPEHTVRWAICGLDRAGIVGPVGYSERG